MISKKFLLYFAFAGPLMLLFLAVRQIVTMLGNDLKTAWSNIVIRNATEPVAQVSLYDEIALNKNLKPKF